MACFEPRTVRPTGLWGVSVVGFKAKNHPQQVGRRGRDDTTDDRRTPQAYWDNINKHARFTLDAAAVAENTKTEKFCRDGLSESWAGERVWCNPPYSQIRPWVEKAWAEHCGSEIIAMLLPNNRTEQGWWQDLVEPYRDNGGVLSTRFYRGRMRFGRPGWNKPRKGDRPPFGCVLLVWCTHELECDMAPCTCHVWRILDPANATKDAK